MKIADLGDAQLHYLDHGAGDPVVLIHGTASDYRAWKPQMDPLGRRHRVIAYSRRYHFPNHPPDEGAPYSPLIHANDLARLLDHLTIEAAHLVGGSFGAYVSLVFATHFPDRTRSLILAEPPILPLLKQTEVGERVFAEFLRSAWEPAREALREGRDEEGVRLFIDGVMGAGAFDSYSPAARRRLVENAPELRAETSAEEYFTPVTPEELGRISVPVLLLAGERSPKMFGMILDVLERSLPNCRRVTIPNASHGMNAQNAEAFNRAVVEFLATF